MEVLCFDVVRNKNGRDLGSTDRFLLHVKWHLHRGGRATSQPPAEFAPLSRQRDENHAPESSAARKSHRRNKRVGPKTSEPLHPPYH
ncbi:hypothetical protein RND71_024134 [Anisodus tanguticus]|uniref:Uncharacterized protein n=1 Tax=Anisodus tanguticus TaxID=243964 RepID=A0AAE1V3P1_9SOLA|nr:hypothetical protein RND71_024134 [Anisodus tanguticus]